MKKFFQEFKEFAMRGNVVDMAVGVVIGGAFSKIVSSLVGDIVMPALSLLTGRISLSNLSAVIPASISGTEPIVIAYGAFLQTVLDFLIIALSIFLAIRLMNKFKRKHEEETPPAPPTPSNEEILLTEIRDLLKEKK